MADNDPIIIGQGNTGSNETSLSRNEPTDGTVFVAQNQNVGDGIHGECTGRNNFGVFGSSSSGHGVFGRSTSNVGVRGSSNSSAGVVGGSISNNGVFGGSTSSIGVSGNSDSSFGVAGLSQSRDAVVGLTLASSQSGIAGSSSGTGGWGVTGRGAGAFEGVVGSSHDPDRGDGVLGFSDHGSGVVGIGNSFNGVEGGSANGFGVSGGSTTSTGVAGSSITGFGVSGSAGDVLEKEPRGGVAGFFEVNSDSAKAGVFRGPVEVHGDLTVTGQKPFKIDHPLDPQNKYLLHNVVEPSERKNVYDGVAQLDGDGEAWVALPEWFEALNGDFRYQLTAVGGAAPNLHVAEEISGNRFKIAGGQGGMKVCWQLTGSRKDPWAAANPFEVEQEKPEQERGRYLHPDLYGAPEEQRVMIRPPEPSGIDLARREEERRLRIDELRRREEERRREMEEQRRRRERQEENEEEAPPEST